MNNLSRKQVYLPAQNSLCPGSLFWQNNSVFQNGSEKAEKIRIKNDASLTELTRRKRRTFDLYMDLAGHPEMFWSFKDADSDSRRDVAVYITVLGSDAEIDGLPVDSPLAYQMNLTSDALWDYTDDERYMSYPTFYSIKGPDWNDGELGAHYFFANQGSLILAPAEAGRTKKVKIFGSRQWYLPGWALDEKIYLEGGGIAFREGVLHFRVDIVEM